MLLLSLLAISLFIKNYELLHEHCNKSPPKNGAIVCDSQYHGQFCVVMCNSKFDFEYSPQASLYICIFDLGKWITDPRVEGLENDNKSVIWPDCIDYDKTEKRKGTDYQYFGGNCEDNHARAELHSNFLEQFQNAALGRYIGCNPHSPDRCTPKNVSIICYSDKSEANKSSLSDTDLLKRSNESPNPPCQPGTQWYSLIKNPKTIVTNPDNTFTKGSNSMSGNGEAIYQKESNSYGNDGTISKNKGSNSDDVVGCKRCTCTEKGKTLCSLCRRVFYECGDVIRSKCYPGVTLQMDLDKGFEIPASTSSRTDRSSNGFCECAFCKSDAISPSAFDHRDNSELTFNDVGYLNNGFSWEMYSKYVELVCSKERARKIADFHQREGGHPSNFNDGTGNENKSFIPEPYKPNVAALWNVLVKHPSHFGVAHYPKLSYNQEMVATQNTMQGIDSNISSSDKSRY